MSIYSLTGPRGIARSGAVLALVLVFASAASATCREDLEGREPRDFRDLPPFQELRLLADSAVGEIHSMGRDAGANAALTNQSRIETLTEILARSEEQITAFRRLSTVLGATADDRITFVAGDGPGAVQVKLVIDGRKTEYLFPLRDGFSNPTPTGYRNWILQGLAALDRYVSRLQEVFSAATDVKDALVNHEPTLHKILFEVDQFAVAHRQMAHYKNSHRTNRPTRLDLQEAKDSAVRDAFVRLDQLATGLKTYIGRMTGRGAFSESAQATFRAELLRKHGVFTYWHGKMARMARQSRDRGWPAPLPSQFSALQRHAEHYQRLITGIVRALDILSAETPLFSAGTDLRALALNAIGSAALSTELADGPLYRGVSYLPLSPYGIARSVEGHLSLVLESNHVLKARTPLLLHLFSADHMLVHDRARVSGDRGMPLVVEGALAVRALTPEGDDGATTRLFIFRTGDVVTVNGVLLRLTSVEGDERGMPTVRGQRVNEDGALGAPEFISFEHQDHWSWYAEGIAAFEAPIRAREERERARRNADTASGGMIGWGGRIFGTPRTGGASN